MRTERHQMRLRGKVMELKRRGLWKGGESKGWRRGRVEADGSEMCPRRDLGPEAMAILSPSWPCLLPPSLTWSSSSPPAGLAPVDLPASLGRPPVRPDVPILQRILAASLPLPGGRVTAHI